MLYKQSVSLAGSCGILAAANFAGCSFDKALIHARIMKGKNGGKSTKEFSSGLYLHEIINLINSLGYKVKYDPVKKQTLNRFVKGNTGRKIAIMCDHVVTVIGSDYFDTFDSGRKFVTGYLEEK